MTLVPARRSSRGQVPIVSIASSKASASRRAAISTRALRRSCWLRLRCTQVSRKRRRSSLVWSFWSIALARRQPDGLTRAPARAAQTCCSEWFRFSTAIRQSSRSRTRRRRSDLSETGTTRFSTRTRRPAAAADGPDDDRAAAVDVAVEQAVQGDDGLVVSGGRVDQVDHQAGLLARVTARDSADALLVDAAGGGGRQVHADRRARRVPALGEQHRVAEHVDVASLEAGEDLGELALRRLAGNGARVDADVLEGLGDVVGVLHARGVDDAGDPPETRAVEVRDRDVERRLVEQLGQLLLVEVLVDLALAQRHLGDRPHARARRDPDAAQRSDHAAAGGLGEVEARGLGREEVGDVAGDQGAGRGHADEDGADPGADAAAGLLAEGGVGLVADDDRVRVRDPACVADEPLVGLDGDRAVWVVRAVEQRRREAIAVAAVGDLADELVDQVAAVGEDQNAARAGRLDEADGGDGLAGSGGVLEPEASAGARILRGLLDDVLVRFLDPVLGLLLLGGLLLLLLDGLLSGVGAGAVLGGRRLLGGRGAAVAVAGPGVAVEALLDVCDQSGERSGESVDLMGIELGAIGEMRVFLGEQALEAEHEGEVTAPFDRRGLAALIDLGERGIQSAAARRAARQVLGLLALEQERLARELPCTFDVGARRRLCRFGGRLGLVSQSEALLIRRSPPIERMARRMWPDHGRHPRYGSPLRALPGSRNLMDR